MTMANEQRLRIVIDVVDRASQTIRSISGRMASELRTLSRRIAIIGAVITGFSTIAILASEKQQVATRLLRGTVESLGGSYFDLLPLITGVIDEQDRLSKFNKTELTDALNIGATALGNVDLALRNLPAAVALASGTGRTVAGAMKLIADAINGDQGARKALAELGVEIGPTSTQFEIAGAIFRRYGGAVEATNTPSFRLRDSIDRIKIAIGNLLTPLVEKLTPAIEGIVNWLLSWIDAHPRLAQIIVAGLAAFGVFALVLGTIGFLLLGLASIFPGIAAGIALAFSPIGSVIILLGALLLANKGIWREIQRIIETFNSFFISNFIPNFRQGLESWKSDWTSVRLFIADIVAGIIDQINNLIRAYNNIPLLPNIPTIPPPNREGPTPAPSPTPSNPVPLPVPTSSLFGTPYRTLSPAELSLFKASGVILAQHGGIVDRPTMLMAGEAGPEAIIPLSRRNGIAGLGASNISFHLHADNSIIGIPDIDRYVLRLIRTAATGGGFNRLLEGR